MAAKPKDNQSEQKERENQAEYDLALAVCVSDFYSSNIADASHGKCQKIVEQHKEELRQKRSQAGLTEMALTEIAALGKGSAMVLRQEVIGMRERMGFNEACEIEKMLIERIILCWLRTIHAEKVYISERQKTESLIKHQEFTDRQALRANTIYLRSIDALNRFRLINARIEEIKSRTPKAEPNKGSILKAV